MVWLRLSALWRASVDAGRLLLVSPFDENITTVTKARAKTRNEFVAALADVITIPFVSSGGKSEAVAKQVLQPGQTLFTVDDKENASLLELGAWPYNLAKIRQDLRFAAKSSAPEPQL